MTEENQDSKIPKLRLSRQADDAKSKATKSEETKQEEATAPKPNLQIKRPGEETKQTPPTPKDTTERKPEPQDEPAFDPKKPFKGIAKAPKEEEGDTSPPALPSKPAPEGDNESGEKLEEAINRIGDEPEEKRARAA